MAVLLFDIACVTVTITSLKSNNKLYCLTDSPKALFAQHVTVLHAIGIKSFQIFFQISINTASNTKPGEFGSFRFILKQVFADSCSLFAVRHFYSVIWSKMNFHLHCLKRQPVCFSGFTYIFVIEQHVISTFASVKLLFVDCKRCIVSNKCNNSVLMSVVLDMAGKKLCTCIFCQLLLYLCVYCLS